jgi:hypothetical protein
VEIQLDKPRRLRFDYNALCDFDNKSGDSLIGIFTEAAGSDNETAILNRLGFGKLRTMLWAGLKWEDRGLTEERVGIILQKQIEDGVGIVTIFGIVMKALIESGVFGTASSDNVNEGNAKAEATE